MRGREEVAHQGSFDHTFRRKMKYRVSAGHILRIPDLRRDCFRVDASVSETDRQTPVLDEEEKSFRAHAPLSQARGSSIA